MVQLPDPLISAEVLSDFFRSIPVVRQLCINLYVLYQSWMECVLALLAARLTGCYRYLAGKQSFKRRQALVDFECLEAEISRLLTHAVKEKQMARLVEINLTIKRLQAELTAAREQL